MMLAAFLIFSFVFATETTAPAFPVCDQLFSGIETSLQNPSAETEVVRRELFKIVNDKRMEVSRFVRQEKESYRKKRDLEIKDFDLKTKMLPPNSDEKNKRREERKQVAARIFNEKKEWNRQLDTQEKQCITYLNQNRESFLSQLRALKKTQAPKPSEPLASPALDEFKEIPKGAGTVLKPQ